MKGKSHLTQFVIIITVIILLSSISITSTRATDNKSGYEIETRTDVLPYPYSRGSAVWVEDESSIYIFGGRNDTEMLDSIMKYTPATDQLDILATRLPAVLMGTTAVFDGKYVYIFGGRDYDSFYDSILRFDPGTETIVNMSARLPKPTVGAAAAWTGEYIYFFGGCWGGIEPEKFDTILRYDPVEDNITMMNSTLPYGRSGLAATWDGKDIYLVGGSDGTKYSAEVFRYSTKNDTLVTLPGKLPTGRNHIQAEYHNGSIYIFGGRGSPTTVYDEILSYDLQTNQVKVLDIELSNPSELRMHAYDGENIYIIGGFSAQKDINQFIRFTPGVEPNGSGKYCPPENQFEYLWIILLILIFVVVISMVNYYRNKKK